MHTRERSDDGVHGDVLAVHEGIDEGENVARGQTGVDGKIAAVDEHALRQDDGVPASARQ